MKIWKWTLAVTDVQTIQMPVGATVLTVQVQGEEPQIWALVDETIHRYTSRKFAAYGTGNPMPDGDPGRYVGTYQIHGGALVFHVFEQKG